MTVDSIPTIPNDVHRNARPVPCSSLRKADRLTSLLVGVDVGTTASKAVVFTTAGRQVAQGRAVTPWVPTPHGAELDAVALLDSTRDALGRALADAPEGLVL